jgi:hypothetical protein
VRASSALLPRRHAQPSGPVRPPGSSARLSQAIVQRRGASQCVGVVSRGGGGASPATRRCALARRTQRASARSRGPTRTGAPHFAPLRARGHSLPPSAQPGRPVGPHRRMNSPRAGRSAERSGRLEPAAERAPAGGVPGPGRRRQGVSDGDSSSGPVFTLPPPLARQQVGRIVAAR